jgi:hypothetical protein
MPMRRCRSQKAKSVASTFPIVAGCHPATLAVNADQKTVRSPLQMRISRWPSRVPGGIFAKLTRSRLKRGIFRPVAELKQAIQQLQLLQTIPDRVAVNLSSKQRPTGVVLLATIAAKRLRSPAMTFTLIPLCIP